MSNIKTTAKRLAKALAGLLSMLIVIIMGLFMAFHWQGESAHSLRVALWIALASIIIIGIFWWLQGKFGKQFRAPTGKEILNDILISLWGAAFVVPFLIVTSDGAVIPLLESALSIVLAVFAIIFPAIRPRTHAPQTT